MSFPLELEDDAGTSAAAVDSPEKLNPKWQKSDSFTPSHFGFQVSKSASLTDLLVWLLFRGGKKNPTRMWQCSSAVGRNVAFIP